ncbi:hypothetical protein PR003_g8150 [Phytophthora rubi]|uniref:6,7-dimethyl-8-ribityllumazine synthase n=1 Tax=Phytophthora rubi TaxID=129364 RepID=A0A6A3MZU7_9STRA|nr:hypothetical protein PR002_g7895 [Phytophthora rubi]KAE9039328.1 hypothetical protein PR001_g7554 [Phytophthora rubi]KAE9345052.1 hypothetical protein PR003_g8150 [Phytophthora rubi]
MAPPGVEKTTAKTKVATKEEHVGGASEHHGEGGSHGHHESKHKTPHSPVLIEQPGATESSRLDGNGLRVTIIASRWYGKVIHSLTEACSEELLDKGVAEDDLHLVEVSGAFELPYAAARVIHCKDSSRRPDAVICVGCIVKDGTHMCETMSQAVANGIMKLNVTSDTPVIFGVLCCENEGQAQSCAAKKASYGGGEGQKCNHGVAWAQSALEMAHLKRCAAGKKSEHCRCTRCESRIGAVGAKQESGKSHESQKTRETCTTCGSSAEKCSCEKCKCKVCCDSRGDCTSCGSSASNCSCEACKCRACCSKREACRGCGCSPDKCSCQDCNCAACSSKKETAGTKMAMPSTEHASKQETQPLLGGQQESSSGGKRVHGGGSDECASCGSPGGKCKCGLLH